LVATTRILVSDGGIIVALLLLIEKENEREGEISYE